MEALIQFQIEQMDGAGVPSPCDKTSDTWWWDFGSQSLKEWADSGVTDIITGPIWRGQNMGNQYDCQTEYDIGQPNPTRYGTRESLQRFAAIAKANGMGLHTDAVIAHRCGWDVRKKSAAGNLLRFPKDRTCFVGPGVAKDHVAVPSEDFAYLFGTPVSYFSSYYGDGKGDNRRGYMLREMKKALRFLKEALDLQGARWDNVKSIDPSVIAQLATEIGLWGTGEMWSSNLDQLLWWIFGTPIAAKSSLFDFPVAFEVRNMCNNTAKYDMRKWQWTGLYQHAPFNSVLFVNSHDLDTSNNRVVYNMLLGYALIITLEGLPCIYVKDWLEKIGYGLENKLENLLWVRKILARGETSWRHTDYNTIVYERMGDPGVLVGINNNSWTGPQYVNVQTKWANQHLHDYSGHMPDVWSDWQGKVTIGIPKNSNGAGYCMYAPDGYQDQKIKILEQKTTQWFEGADDLDILPAAKNGAHVMRLWCAPDEEVHLDKPTGDGVRFSLTGTGGEEIIPRGNWVGKTKAKGWHSLQSFSPTDTPTHFKVGATYKAPRGL